MKSISQNIKNNRKKIIENIEINNFHDQSLEQIVEAIDRLNDSLDQSYLKTSGGAVTGKISSNSEISAPVFKGELDGLAQKAQGVQMEAASSEAKLLVLDPNDEKNEKIKIANSITMDPATETLKVKNIEAEKILGQSEKASKLSTGENKETEFKYEETETQPEYLWGTSTEAETKLFKILDLCVKKADKAAVADKLTEKTVGAEDTPVYLNKGVPVAGKKLGSAAYMSTDDFSAAGHTHDYLPLGGGNMQGKITAKGEACGDDPADVALNMNNSNMSGIIAMYFSRSESDVNDGLNFPNGDKTFDRIFASNGNLYFVPKRNQFEKGDEKIVLHSGNYEMYAAPVTHTHPYISSLGGTVTGDLSMRPETGMVGGRIKLRPSLVQETESGIAIEQHNSGLRIYGIPSADEKTVTGTGTPLIINPYDKTIIGGYKLIGSLEGTATNSDRATVSDSTDKLNNPLTLSGTEEIIGEYDGSNPKTITITPASIGAAPLAHEHAQYLTEHQDITGKANINGKYPEMQVGYANEADHAKASDVHEWAKSKNKPTYSWNEINEKPQTFKPAEHSHKYAGSTGEGGAANSANMLNENNVLSFSKSGFSYFSVTEGNAKATEGATLNAVPSLNQAYSILRLNYGNSNGYLTDIAASVSNTNGLYYRQIRGGSEIAYRRILDSSNWSAYCAAASHVHSYLPLSGGTITGQIKKEGVSSSWIAGRTTAPFRVSTLKGYSAGYSQKTMNGTWELGAYDNAGFTDKLCFTYVSDADFTASNNRVNGQITFSKDGAIDATGNITGNKVFNSVYNDYAEFFPRGEETEPGDLIALDLNSYEEKYVKASVTNPCVVGTHSDEFAHLIGGETPPNGEDFVEYNIKKYIPVSLAGRVRVKFVGRAVKGTYAVPSNIAGAAKMSKNPEGAIGIIVESDNRQDIRRVKILLKK